GHVAGALLVAGEHVAQRRAARERVVDREDRTPGDPEGDLDALGLERAEDCVGAQHARHVATSEVARCVPPPRAALRARPPAAAEARRAGSGGTRGKPAVSPAMNSTSVRVVGIRSSTVSMKSRVVAAGPTPATSGVRTPAASVLETARSRVRPAVRSPRPSESINAAASSIPLGFATPWPAMSGAEPCVGPKMPGPV